MTYTIKDLTALRAKISQEAEPALAAAEAKHGELVDKYRADGSLFSADAQAELAPVIEARALASQEVVRLRAQEAEVRGFLGGYSPAAEGQEAPVGHTEDWAYRAARGAMFEAFRSAGGGDQGALAARAAGGQEVFTRGELESAFKGRAFDAAAGAGLRTPDYTSIRRDVLVRKPRLLDFISVLTTDTDVVDWVDEGAQTNNVGYADYGSTVSESAYSYSHLSTTISRITSWISATDGQLSDASQTESLLRTRLIEAVNRFVEQEAYTGDGTGTGVAKHLLGFANAAGLPTAINGTGMTPFDAVMEAIVAIQSSSLLNLDPTAILINPVDYKKIVLEKDQEGRYQVSNPTAQALLPVWGLIPVITPLVTAGTVWVADPSQHTLFLRKGLELSMSDNVGTDFLNGIKRIKTEMRLGALTLRSGAFQKITNFGA